MLWSVSSRRFWFSLTLGGLLLSCTASAQQARHGRGYKAPPPTAPVVVLVEKGFNEKPFPNASVIFRAEREGKLTGNLETKTDPDGKATLDLLEVGSHVTVQVIASGFATYASDFDLTADGKQMLVKLQRPRAQVSTYTEDKGKAADTQPGVQEHRSAVPSPTPAPGQTAPLTTTPITQPPASTQSPQTGSPQ